MGPRGEVDRAMGEEVGMKERPGMVSTGAVWR